MRLLCCVVRSVDRALRGRTGPCCPRWFVACRVSCGSIGSSRWRRCCRGTVAWSVGTGPIRTGPDYSAEAVESINAVVVIVIVHPHAAGEACADVGARRTTTVDLAEPLGERAVLEAQQSLPVPLTITA